MKLNNETAKNNPFRVPEDYFDTLADRTMAAIREEKEAGRQEGELPSVPPVVQPGDAGHGKQGMMIKGQGADQAGASEGKRLTGLAGTSEGGRMTALAGTRGRVVHFRPLLALAAAILGFAILATAVVKLVTSDRPGSGTEIGSSLFADLAAEEIDTYMLENELTMTDNVSGEMPDEAISTEAIIEYLMTEDIDLDEIYELF